MRYAAIAQQVEAACFTLGDRQWVAVARDELITAMPVSAFLFLFQPAESVMGAPEPPPAAHRRRKPKPAPKTGGRPSPLTDAIMGVIEAETLVTSEVVDHVCREIGSTRNAVTARLCQLAKAGRIEKREQPETRLDKWYLVEAKCLR